MDLPLSVVVPCYGRADLTRRLLESFARSDDRFEVILVDDAGSPPVTSTARGIGDRLDLRIVRHERNRGPAAARNTGVSMARHDIIAFTDNDCEVAPDWAKQLYVYLRDAPATVAAVGGRVLAAGRDVYSRYFAYHKILDPFLSDGRYLYVVTANCAFRRPALIAVDGFDEQVAEPGGEDPGLSFKLLRAGYTLHYRREAVVWHHYRLGVRDFMRTFYRYVQGCRQQTDAHGRGLGASMPSIIGFGGM